MTCALAAGLLLLGAAASGQVRGAAAPLDPAADFHSYANVDQFVTTHIELVLDVDFDARQLIGSVVLDLKRLDPGATQVVLDTKDLNVLAVSELSTDILGATEKPKPMWVSRPFHPGDADPILGTPLVVDLPPSKQGSAVIKIEYETSPQARGLQWRAPSKADPKQARFLYSLSEPINARSWIPLQDTPRVRPTYRAHIHTPDDLVALMGAINDPKVKRNGDYWFVMSRAIPSWQIALVVGDLVFKPTGARTGVYAERPMAGAAAAEFGDAEAMIQAAEQLLGAYRWERHDVVVMPSSFPLADTDDPRLSFFSPTVLAGDKSLVGTLAYAVAHTWSGDLVTHAAWRDRWLGQAVAAYLAVRMMSAVYGEGRGLDERIRGLRSLREAMRRQGPGAGALAADLQGQEWDDIFDDISREKGRLFFAYLETKFGRARLDAFLRAYFERFAWQSVTTEQFMGDLQENLLGRYPGIVTPAEAAAWIYDPGIPADAVMPDVQALAPLDAARAAWTSGGIKALKLQTPGWEAPQWRRFLGEMPAGIGTARLAELDRAYSLSSARNAEIAACWFALAIREGYEGAYPRLEDYLRKTGRLTLIEPLYEALMKSDRGAALARRVYAQARPGYHPFVARRIDAIAGPQAGDSR